MQYSSQNLFFKGTWGFIVLQQKLADLHQSFCQLLEVQISSIDHKFCQMKNFVLIANVLKGIPYWQLHFRLSDRLTQAVPVGLNVFLGLVGAFSHFTLLRHSTSCRQLRTYWIKFKVPGGKEMFLVEIVAQVIIPLFKLNKIYT